MRGRLARSETIQSFLPQTLSDERQAAAMNTTTCLDRDQILDLCELIHTSHSGNLPVAGSRVLGLFRCIQVTLLTLRHNLTQELLADILMVSQATISRVVAVYTPLIADLLQAWVPGVEDPRPGSVSTSLTVLWRPAGHGTTVPNCTQANTTPQE